VLVACRAAGLAAVGLTVRYATCDLQNRLTLSAHKTTPPGIVIHRAVEATASGKWAITVESCGARLAALYISNPASK